MSFCASVTQKRPQVQVTTVSKVYRNATDVNNSSAPIQLTKTGDTITLSWSRTVNYIDTVLFYQLYYSHKADTTWTLVKDNIPVSDSPSVRVLRSDVDATDSIFYFSVRCVTREGVASDPHASNDATAAAKGWYLLWSRK
jgi:hypothetical protein